MNKQNKYTIMRAGVIVSKVYSSSGISTLSGWGIFTIRFGILYNRTVVRKHIELIYSMSKYIALHLTITINFLLTNIYKIIVGAAVFSDMVVSYKIIYYRYDLDGYFKMP